MPISFKITLSSAPQGERVIGYKPLRPSRYLKVFHGNGDVDVCNHLCTRESTGESDTVMLAILMPYLHFLDMNVARTPSWADILLA